MKKTKKTEPYKVFEVKTFVKARNATEARKLASKQEPHEILIMRTKTVEGNAAYVDAVSYIELPDEWEDEDVPDEYSLGYQKGRN